MLRPIHALRTNDLPAGAAEPEKVNDAVDETIRILILAGSLRRDSYNRALARAAAQLATSGVSTATFDSLGALPFYDGDVEDEGLPATVVALRQAIVEADALLLATPEYNGATSGVLKNALDWASRGPARILAGKPVAVVGASTGASGAKGGIESVVRILGRTRSDVLDHLVAVPFAARAFDDDLALQDSDIRAEVAELVAQLADRARSNTALAA
jgi:chromate reductase